MRKLVAGFASSVDDYIEGPNREYDWILIDKEIDFNEQAKRFDTYFMGRLSYEAIKSMGGTGTKNTKHYVFSNTLSSVDKNYILINRNVKEEVIRIKEQEGKDIALWGGASLLASLLDLKLVNEIEIAFIPVLLGKGKPMVDVLKDKVWLTFLKSKAYSNGTLSVSYAVEYKSPKKKKSKS